MKSNNMIIHGLWIGPTLQPLEILTIRSFLQHGHRFQLWTYGEVGNVPEGTEVMNAEEVIPRNRVFNYKRKNRFGHGKGSYAGFSDIFRYRLLYLQGGIWVDMDITCLQPFDFEEDFLFRYHHKFGNVGNVMKCPKGAEVMNWCYEKAVREVDEDNVQWELPITILNDGIHRFSLDACTRAISNIDSWPVVARHIAGRPSIPGDWYAIHWMNEEWRRLDLDKDSLLPSTNLSDLFTKHDIAVSSQTGVSALRTRIKLHRFYYGWKNIGVLLSRSS